MESEGSGARLRSGRQVGSTVTEPARGVQIESQLSNPRDQNGGENPTQPNQASGDATLANNPGGLAADGEELGAFHDASDIDWSGSGNVTNNDNFSKAMQAIQDSLSLVKQALQSKEAAVPDQAQSGGTGIGFNASCNNNASSIPVDVTIAPERRVRPSVSKTKIKVFPFDGTTAWPEYLIQFNTVSAMNGWDEHEKLGYLVGSLQGVAREVLGDVDPAMRGNFDSLVTYLNKRFGPEKQEDVFKALLKGRTQKEGESFPELAHEIRRWVRNAFPGAPYPMLESMAKDYFIDAIRNPEVHRVVYQKEPRDLDEAVKAAIKMSSCSYPKSVGYKSVRFVQSQPPSESSKPEAKALEDLQAQMAEIWKTINKSKICYHCGRSGHVKVDCPDRGNQMICFHCSRPGHVRSDCPERSRISRSRKGGKN